MTKTQIVSFSILFGLLIVVGTFWYFSPTAENVSGINTQDAQLVSRGRAVYSEECAACHGKNLEGQTANWRQRLADGSLPAPPHDESGHTWHHLDGLLFKVTKFGPSRSSGALVASTMPAFGEKLSDRDIWAVLTYIKSRWPAQIRVRHDELNKRYRENQ